MNKDTLEKAIKLGNWITNLEKCFEMLNFQLPKEQDRHKAPKYDFLLKHHDFQSPQIFLGMSNEEADQIIEFIKEMLGKKKRKFENQLADL